MIWQLLIFVVYLLFSERSLRKRVKALEERRAALDFMVPEEPVCDSTLFF